MRCPVDRIADDLDVRNRCGDPFADAVDEVAQPLRLAGHRGVDRAQGGRGGDDRRQVRRARSIAGGAFRLGPVRRRRRIETGAGPHREDADTGRTAPLTRAGQQHRPAGRHRSLPDQHGRVDEQRYAHLRTSGSGEFDRLHGADLVAGRDQSRERDTLTAYGRVP